MRRYLSILEGPTPQAAVPVLFTEDSEIIEAVAEALARRLQAEHGGPDNGRALRLVSAPRGESSGWLDFRVVEMVQTAGRPISTGLRLLLSEQRLLALHAARRSCEDLLQTREATRAPRDPIEPRAHRRSTTGRAPPVPIFAPLQ